MNMLLTYFNDISPDSWIQLVSGLGAVVVAFMAIIHGNKNSRKALEQQNGILVNLANASSSQVSMNMSFFGLLIWQKTMLRIRCGFGF